VYEFFYHNNAKTCYFRLDLSVINLVMILKLAETVFTSPSFRALWPNWLICLVI